MPFTPLPLGITFAAVADLVAFLVLLAGGAPSILVTSSRLLLDPPLASLNLPGPPGCLFPVISLLNSVVGHLKSVAQPVCDAVVPVICSCRTQYMYAAIILVCSLVLQIQVNQEEANLITFTPIVEQQVPPVQGATGIQEQPK